MACCHMFISSAWLDPVGSQRSCAGNAPSHLQVNYLLLATVQYHLTIIFIRLGMTREHSFVFVKKARLIHFI